MKYSYSALAIAAIFTLVSAQSTVIPACAQPCIDDAVKSATTCSASDTLCKCTTANQKAITLAATTCVLQKCSTSDALAAQAAGAAVCAAATAAAPTTAAPTSAAAVTSAAPTSAAPTSAAAVTSAASAISSAAASTIATSTLAATSGVAQSTGKAGNGTTSAKPSQFSGAASQLGAGAGGIIALGVAALAIL